MKVLLHTCCAPCIIFPFKQLNKKGIEVLGFFYNPNIFPISEYKARRDALVSLSGKQNIDVLFPEYSPSDFFSSIKENESGPERCQICWSMRLRRTARVAKERGFDSFSTTLLVSPYQDQEKLKEIGEKVSGEENITFYYEDFRPGFRSAHNEAKEKGLYCQKYCGCVYSEAERSKKSEKLPHPQHP